MTTAPVDRRPANRQALRMPGTAAVRCPETLTSMDYQFRDLVDIPEFAKIMRTLNTITGLGSALADESGVIVAEFGWQEICQRFHRVCPGMAMRCDHSDRFLGNSLNGASFAGHKCGNGLMDYATSVEVQGRKLGVIYAGQVFHEPPDEEFFRRQAWRFGLDEEDYIAAVRRVPVISRERVEKVMMLYVQFAQMLAARGLERLKLVEATESVRRLAHLVESSDDAILGETLDGIIVSWNRGAERIYGYLVQDVLGQSIRAVLTAQQTAEVKGFLERIGRGERVDHYETTRFRKDGRQIDVSLTMSPVLDEEGRIVGSSTIARDITQRKQVERAHLESERKFRTIFNSAFQCIALLAVDGSVLEYNSTALEAGGQTIEDVAGQPFWAVGSSQALPEACGRVREAVEKAARGELARCEVSVKNADGEEHTLDLSVKPVRDEQGEVTMLIAEGRDITERKRSEEKLQVLQEMAETRAMLIETTSQVALDILSSRTGVEALRNIAEAARLLLRAASAAVTVPSAGGDGFQVITGLGEESQPSDVEGCHLSLSARVEDLERASAAEGPEAVAHALETEDGRLLVAPLRRGETRLGHLYAAKAAEEEPFGDADRAILSILARHAALVVHNMAMAEGQRALMRGMINAHEDERRSIAYDLHDGLTQYVMASHAHLEAFRRARETGNEERAARELAKGLEYLKESVTESRRLVNGLRALALDDMGLAGVLEQLFNEERARVGWPDAVFKHNIEGRRFDSTLETAVYRVAQEALTNTRKHAEAKKVRMTLRMDKVSDPSREVLMLEVQDWGKGFQTGQEAGESHIGLKGMLERVTLVGGTYSLESSPGKGTRLRAVFPVLESRRYAG